MYLKEKEIQHLIKRLKPKINYKINWANTGVLVTKTDEILEKIVGNLEYILKNPDVFQDKHQTFECVCMFGDTCCECDKKLFEDDYECGPEPCADEMHDFYILHRRCPECEMKKLKKARDFILNFDDPFQYRVSISEQGHIEYKQDLEKGHKKWEEEKQKEKKNFNFYVIPECEYITEECWCSRVDKGNKHYGCNEIWCEKKIENEEMIENNAST